MFNKCKAVGIKVSDFAKAFNFYKDVLQLEVKTSNPENDFAEFKVGDLVIALLTETTLEEMCGSSYLINEKSSNHLFAVEVSNVKDTYRSLKDKVEFIQKPKTTPWGQKVMYFKDIEGYIWEISERFEE